MLNLVTRKIRCVTNVVEPHTKKTSHIAAVPVVIVGHLLHDLAIDLIPEHLVFCGGPKDLVGELEGTLRLLGGVISHIFQDGCTSVKDERTTSALNFEHKEVLAVSWSFNRRQRQLVSSAC